MKRSAMELDAIHRGHSAFQTPVQRPTPIFTCLSPPALRRANSRGGVTPSLLNSAFSFECISEEKVTVKSTNNQGNSFPQDQMNLARKNMDQHDNDQEGDVDQQADLEVEAINNPTSSNNDDAMTNGNSRRQQDQPLPKSTSPPLIPNDLDVDEWASRPPRQKFCLTPRIRQIDCHK